MTSTSPSPSTDAAVPPFLRREAERQLPGIQDAVARVVRSGRFLFGDELRAFEAELATSLELPFALGVGSGTDALQLALRALGVGPGDEVVTQSHSSPFTVIAIHEAGATPVLVESSEDDFGMDVDACAAAIGPRTRAILPVHLYGHPVRIEQIVDVAAAHGVPVVEDCAQAHGATVGGRPAGTFGTLGCFSFYPTKNLGSLGDGGAVVTRDPELKSRIERLRNGGLVAHGIHAGRGITSRLSELQAAVLRLRLGELEVQNARRRAHADAYDRAVQGVMRPRCRSGCRWAPHQYVVRHPQRDRLRERMAAAGWPLLVHYPLPIHLQDGFRSALCRPEALPIAERLAAEVLSLPTSPEMRDDEREDLVRHLVDAAVERR